MENGVSLMELQEYLYLHRERIPNWLDRYKPNDPFSYENFFSSRIVYYPGSGTDGHPVRLFGSSHCAHCFVFADYGVAQDDIQAQLAHPNHGFLGYHTLARLQLEKGDLTPNGWTDHLTRQERQLLRPQFAPVLQAPLGFLEILERDPSLGDDHGASRLAILFLDADGIATYAALFCQDKSASPPWAVLLQDHGFGGNYNSFGQGDLLEEFACRCAILPMWLLVAENTRRWDGFERVVDVEGDKGGEHNMLRSLYV